MTQVLSHAPEIHGGEHDHHPDLVDQDDLRTEFAVAMSAMYKQEVPLYGDLVQIVREVNQATIEEGNQAHRVYEEERLDLERHGAIRLGSPQELRVIRRVFALIGLYPVGYYDLSAADLPMHATAFRPVSQRALTRNPFRVFTTILRPDLLEPRSRDLALSMITRRKMFTDQLLDHIEQDVPLATLCLDQALKSEHAILADISCFGTAHINHLTPRTLDIDRAHTLMKCRGLKVKDDIEGPPRRSVPVLLRQTSFLALEERTHFSGRGGAATVCHNDTTEVPIIQATHKARFGEIEQRGAAVTPKGRSLYDAVLAEGGRSDWPNDFNARLPDDWNDLLEQGLVYCLYRVKTANVAQDSNNLGRTEPVTVKQLLNEGILEAIPQTYEDFLPISAAGIFRSNLSESGSSISSHLSRASVGTAAGKPYVEHDHQSFKVNWSFSDQDGFEEALGRKVIDPYQWYANAQEESLQECSRILGMAIRERV